MGIIKVQKFLTTDLLSLEQTLESSLAHVKCRKGKLKNSLGILQITDPPGIKTSKFYFDNSFLVHLSTIWLNYCKATDSNPLLFFFQITQRSVNGLSLCAEVTDVGEAILGMSYIKTI